MNELAREGSLDPAHLRTDYDARATVTPERFAQEMHAYRTLSDAMREPWGRHFDVVYDPASGQMLDIFGPPPDGRLLPVFLFIHGGYWRALSRHDSAMMAGMLARHGIATVTVDYRLAPEVTLTEIVRELRAAVAFLWREGAAFGLDPSRIHAGGSSAGGHLTAMLLAEGWHDDSGVPANVLKSALLISGLFELAPIAATFPQEWLRLEPAEIEALSPARHLPGQGCPAVIAWAEGEAAGFRRQSLAFAGLWAGAGFPVRLVEVPGRNHFDILTELTDPATHLSQALLDEVLGQGVR